MKTKLITIFVLAVFLGVDLDGIIGQMNKLVVSLAELKLQTTSTNISLAVPITFYFAVETY
jgi:hypothetical protein